MQTTSCLVPIAVMLLAAQVAQAQQVDCRNVQFSEAVTQKFPRVREACLDVIERQGELLAVFKADLLKVSGNKVRIRARLPDGGHADAQTVQVDPERRVLVNDKKYRVDELAIGQELTIYAKVDEPLVALAPEDASVNPEFAPIEIVPDRVVAAAEPQMPMTARELPALGVLGALLACLGVALELMRRIRKLRSLMPERFGNPHDRAMSASRAPAAKGASR